MSISRIGVYNGIFVVSGVKLWSADRMMLFRYLNSRFVEAFKKEGVLRLCPIVHYHTIDGVRQDAGEGIATVATTAKLDLTAEQSEKALGLRTNIRQTGGSFIVKYQLPAGYLLCTSTHSSATLICRFGVDDFFRIKNPKLFEEALARAIAEVCPIEHVRSGPVKYVDDTSEQFDTRNAFVSRQPAARTIDDYFVKCKREYEIEAEYRFVFVVGAGRAEKPLLIRLTQREVQRSCLFL